MWTEHHDIVEVNNLRYQILFGIYCLCKRGRSRFVFPYVFGNYLEINMKNPTVDTGLGNVQSHVDRIKGSSETLSFRIFSFVHNKNIFTSQKWC